LHPSRKSGHLCAVAFRLARPSFELKYWNFGLTEKLEKRGNEMKTAMMLKASAAALCLGALVGCTDLKPIQAQIDELKSQVQRVQQDAAAAKESAGSAASAASAAQQAANGAQSSANQALSAAQASQSCCDATNEKIDRMFKKSMSK
jgi:hypothetical protein